MKHENGSSTGNHIKILIIEDDPQIIDFLSLGLDYEDFEVSTAGTGRAGIELFHQDKPGLVILDLRLPDLDGAEVCQHLRALSNVPVLVLTARDQIKEKVKLLTIGADDYMVKPFSFDELLARIRRLLQRTGVSEKKQSLRFQDIEVRLDTRDVLRAGTGINLSVKEFDLLVLLMSNPNKVLTNESILNAVWGYESFHDSNSVQVYVSHLRRKLGTPEVIQTIRGVGYSLRSQP